MAMIRFTANHEDLSTDRGFQFKFLCDRCHNGHLSKFQPSATGTAGSMLRAAGGIFGGLFSSAGQSAYEVQRAVGGKAHDAAFEKAVEEGKTYFHQCRRCGKWVCPDVCWNEGAGQCVDCSPDLDQEIASSRAQAMAEAAREQLRVKAQSTDYAGDVDVTKGSKSPKGPLACPSCGAKTAGGKFCPECGGPLSTKTKCKGCGHEVEGSPKFCPECGGKIAG